MFLSHFSIVSVGNLLLGRFCGSFGLYLLKEFEEDFRRLGIGEVLGGSGERLGCGVEFADTEQVVSEQELEVCVESVEVCLFG